MVGLIFIAIHLAVMIAMLALAGPGRHPVAAGLPTILGGLVFLNAAAAFAVATFTRIDDWMLDWLRARWQTRVLMVAFGVLGTGLLFVGLSG